MTDKIDTEPPQERRSLGPSLFVFLLALQLALLWAYPRVPSGDGPAHQYSAWVYLELLEDEQARLGQIFKRRDGYFFPNAMYSFLLVGASSFLSADQAQKLASSVYVLALAASFLWFSRELVGRSWLPPVMLFITMLNYLFFMGWLNFLLGVPFALVAIASLQRYLRARSLQWLVVTNTSLLLAYWSHLVSFGLGLIAVVTLTAIAGRSRWLSTAWTWLPAASLVALSWHESANVASDWQYRDVIFERLWRIISFRVATSFGGLEIPIAAAVGTTIILVTLVVGIRHKDRKPWPPVLILALVMLALGLMVPRGAGAGYFIDDRVSLFFWLMVFACAGYAGPSLSRLGYAIVVVLSLLQAVHLFQIFRGFNEEYEVFLQGAEQIPEGAEVFAYSFLEPPELGVLQPFASPNSQLSLATRSPNYHLYQADPRHSGHFLLSYTEEGLSRYVGERDLVRIHHSEYSGFVQYVMFWGRRSGVEASFRRYSNYGLVYKNSKLRLYRQDDVPLEERLRSLTIGESADERLRLALRIVRGLEPGFHQLQPGELFAVNLHPNLWTRGTRQAAVVFVNRSNTVEVPILKIRGSGKVEGGLQTVFIEDGEGVTTLGFTRRQSRRIELAPVEPGQERLYVVWADRGWSTGNVYSPRRVGVRLTSGRRDISD